MTSLVPPAADYRSLFQEQRQRSGPEPAWLTRVRQAAIERFGALGFPTSKLEAWKYLDVGPVAQTPFRIAPVPGKRPSLTDLAPYLYDDLPGPRLVFVNGRHEPTLSRVPPLPKGVHVGSLAEALRSDAAPLEPHLAKHADAERHPFVALNTALFADGAFVHVPPGAVLAETVQLLFVTVPGTEPALTSPRNLILAGSNSQLRVIETYAGTGTAPYLTNAVTELILRDNAIVEHHKMQREAATAYHVGVLEAHQERASSFTSHNFAIGGRLVRNEVNTLFNGEGGEATLNGLYLLKGEQHVDNHTFIDHAQPHCTSRELYKGILDERSRGVFYGKITVAKDAQKTDASQTNKNLLLSDGALVDSIPALEINADDVRCQHGSTIGQLDRDQLFYLTSRGLDEATARSLLIWSFARELINRVHVEPVRRNLEYLLRARLPKGEAVQEAFE